MKPVPKPATRSDWLNLAVATVLTDVLIMLLIFVLIHLPGHA